MKLEQYYEIKPWRINQVWGVKNPIYEQFGFSRHNGTDVAIGVNALVCSPFPCEVTKIGYQAGGAGHYICILSKFQYEINGKLCWIEKTYMHLEKTIAKVGDSLSAGDTLAKADNSGFSTGPHTHIASKRVMKTPGGYYAIDKNEANSTFDDSSFYNGKYSIDLQITLLQQTILLLTKLLPFLSK